MKRNIVLCVLISLLCALSTATAGTKEEIMRLQSDVLQLQNQIRDFEKAFQDKTDGLKSLVVQLNDQVAKSNMYLERVSKTLESQASGAQSTDEKLLQEIRALSGKIDDFGTRISAMAQQISDLKIQSKSLNEGGTPGGVPSEDSLYNQAYNDYVAGNLDLALQGFNAYMSSYPNGKMAAVVQMYIGDYYSRQGKLPQAITAFTRVISDYPGAEQVPGALYKRGRAELAQQESDNAIADFKDIIERFPASPEAELAKSQLRDLGVNPNKPAPAKEQRRKSR
jgi:tol-pal system protein YbgF